MPDATLDDIQLELRISDLYITLLWCITPVVVYVLVFYLGSILSITWWWSISLLERDEHKRQNETNSVLDGRPRRFQLLDSE
jgi:hypothetical protein